jgi:hypothetical protein
LKKRKAEGAWGGGTAPKGADIGSGSSGAYSVVLSLSLYLSILPPLAHKLHAVDFDQVRFSLSRVPPGVHVLQLSFVLAVLHQLLFVAVVNSQPA